MSSAPRGGWHRQQGAPQHLDREHQEGILGGRHCQAPKNKKEMLSGSFDCSSPKGGNSVKLQRLFASSKACWGGGLLGSLPPEQTVQASCCCFALWSAAPSLPGTQAVFCPSHAPIKNFGGEGDRGASMGLQLTVAQEKPQSLMEAAILTIVPYASSDWGGRGAFLWREKADWLAALASVGGEGRSPGLPAVALQARPG